MKHSYLSVLLALLAAAAPGQDTFTFRGRVVDAGCQPLAGAGILVGTVDQVLTATALEQPTVRTGGDGTFTVAVPHGMLWSRQYCLLVAAPGKVVLQHPVGAHVKSALQQARETTLPDLILEDGTTLKGRVRTADGKPLPGARVTARDLVTAYGLTSWNEQYTPRPQSHALTGADGTFTLPGTHQSGIEVLVDCPGFYRQHLLPVSEKDPLVLEPEPGGFVRGTLVTPDGKPRGGTLKLVSEASHEELEVTVPADGTFTLPLRFRGRYRVQCVENRTELGAPWFRPTRIAGQSEVLAGPADGIVVKTRTTRLGTLRVRAVDTAGKPVLRFTAGIAWTHSNWAGAGEVGQFDTRDDPPAGADGIALVPGPDEDERHAAGILRVRAPGLVPCVRKDLKWEQDGQEVEVKLRPEAVLAGRVVDSKTGAAIAGAQVRVMLPTAGDTGERWLQFMNMARLGTVATTAADGSFRIGSLPKGRHQVFAQAPGRPEARALQVNLEEAQTRADLEVPLAAGAGIAGTLSNGAVPPGARVVRYEDPGVLGSLSFFLTSSYYLEDPRALLQAARVQQDGGFRLDGLPPGALDLGMEVPLPLRNGRDILGKLEPVRLDAGEVLEEDFDLRAALPAVIEGRVILEGDPMPISRLCVRARLANAGGFQAVVQQMDFGGPEWSAVPDADARYRLRLPPGTATVRVVDLVTGVEFAREEVNAEAGKTRSLELSCKVAKLRARLRPEGRDPVVAERLVIQAGDEEEGNQFAVFAFLGGWNNLGVPLSCGTSEVDVFVPPGTTRLKVLSGAQRLAGGQMPEEPQVLGELEHEAKAGEQPVLNVPVAAPPEVK